MKKKRHKSRSPSIPSKSDSSESDTKKAKRKKSKKKRGRSHSVSADTTDTLLFAINPPTTNRHIFVQRSHSRLPSSEESPERKQKEEKHRRASAHSEGSVTENAEHHELSEDELEKQRAQLLRELQMQQEDN